MSKILSALMNRGKGKELSDLQKAVVHSITAAEGSRPLSEHEEAQNLGINRAMIQDDGLLKWLDALAKVKGSDPNYPIIDLNMLALRIKASPLLRTSYVDEADAKIAMLEAEQFIDRVEMELDEDTYDYGGTNFLEAMKDIIITSWADSTNGRKAKLLKVQPKAFEISVPEQQQKKAPSRWPT